jgi:hypothetical protein
MTIKTFKGQVTIDFWVEINERVLDVTKDENWKKVFYDLEDEKEVVKMIVMQLLSGGSLDELDGWVGMHNSDAKITDEDWSLNYVEEKKIG